jgi:hypothetical protein
VTDKTTEELIHDHQARASKLLLGWEDRKSQIRESGDLRESGGYADRLSDEERRRILLKEKREAAEEGYQRTLEDYRKEVVRYHDELDARLEHVEEQLFSVKDASAIATAARASDEELSTLMDRALLTRNHAFAHAIAVEAHARGMGDLLHRFFEESGDDKARALYAEFSNAPSRESRALQLESIDRIVQPLNQDRLIPYARANSS